MWIFYDRYKTFSVIFSKYEFIKNEGKYVFFNFILFKCNFDNVCKNCLNWNVFHKINYMASTFLVLDSSALAFWNIWGM